MVPLALTSTAGWIRRLGGRRWQTLHRLVYVSAIGGVVHYWWLVKADISRPVPLRRDRRGAAAGPRGLGMAQQRPACRGRAGALAARPPPQSPRPHAVTVLPHESTNRRESSQSAAPTCQWPWRLSCLRDPSCLRDRSLRPSCLRDSPCLRDRSWRFRVFVFFRVFVSTGLRSPPGGGSVEGLPPARHPARPTR